MGRRLVPEYWTRVCCCSLVVELTLLDRYTDTEVILICTTDHEGRAWVIQYNPSEWGFRVTARVRVTLGGNCEHEAKKWSRNQICGAGS
jgi:hypothetical protein